MRDAARQLAHLKLGTHCQSVEAGVTEWFYPKPQQIFLTLKSIALAAQLNVNRIYIYI